MENQSIIGYHTSLWIISLYWSVINPKDINII